jgi:acetyl-CoA carboxylase carboxyltransferase component
VLCIWFRAVFVMVKKQAHVLVGGPPLVKSAFGEDISKEELGGYKPHTRLRGVVDKEAEDENHAWEQIKIFLLYLPSNVRQMPKRQHDENDDPRPLHNPY